MCVHGEKKKFQLFEIGVKVKKISNNNKYKRIPNNNKFKRNENIYTERSSYQ